MVITFKDLSDIHISELWNHGSNVDGWPEPFTTITDLQQYIQIGNLPDTFVNGSVKGIWLGNSLTGFVTLHEIEPGFTDNDSNIYEGGTYLLQRFRGIGLNEPVKRHLVETTFQAYNASWCLFCIPCDNRRAIFAMDKLPLPFERITITDTHHSLYRYLKWKSWKVGKEFILYAISRYKYT
jgi:hypothetical protein